MREINNNFISNLSYNTLRYFILYIYYLRKNIFKKEKKYLQI